MNKKRKIISIVILILIVLYWGIAFIMRDKSPNWCNSSLGTYDRNGVQDINESKSDVPIPLMPNRGSGKVIYGCTGGIFGFMDKNFMDKR